MKYILLVGSNEEPRLWYIKKSIEMISEISQILSASSLYESEAWGFRSYPFLNICVEIDTYLYPKTFLKFLKRVETFLGRFAKVSFSSSFFYEPRPIDVDIIFWEGGVFEDEELVIPHPLAHRRKFVLLPLAEMWGDFVHPVIGETIIQILQKVDDDSFVYKVGRLL